MKAHKADIVEPVEYSENVEEKYNQIYYDFLKAANQVQGQVILYETKNFNCW